MRNRKSKPADLLGSQPIQLRIRKIREENRRKADASRLKRSIELQPELEMGQAKIIVCPGCGGLGCRRCQQRGVIEGEIREETSRIVSVSDQSGHGRDAVTPIPAKCSLCYGVGRVANVRAITRMCPKCYGSGGDPG